MRKTAFWEFVALGALLFSCSLVAAEETEDAKAQRLLSVFRVVNFPNDVCIGDNSKNGTCYTKEECANKGGTSSGSCADGFGVCCTFVVTCGGSSSENTTYFETQSVASGMCKVSICPVNENICKLRLDLETFVITGPSTLSTSQYKTLGGAVSSAGTVLASTATQCLTDTFKVTGSNNLPVICGTMTGEHVYVDSMSTCNDISFNFGSTAKDPTKLAGRAWKIKVSQIECSSKTLPPAGCHQYFFGNTKATIQTFNFQGGQHLANQQQNICVRRETKMCQICYATAADTDFVLSGKATSMMGHTGTETCCGYGSAGAGTKGFDCVIIPGMTKKSDGKNRPNQLCGRSKGIFTVAGTTPASACSKTLPFMVTFLSDNFEVIGSTTTDSESAILNKGFKLVAEQLAC